MAPYSPTAAPMFQLSSDSQMAFYLKQVMALSNTGGANSAQVLRIATQLVPHDFESTYNAFYDMAERVNAIASSIDSEVDPVGAREHYFHAATYYRGSVFFLIGNQSDRRLASVWDQALTAFNKANALLSIPGQRITLNTHSDDLGDYEIVGIFYKAKSSQRKLPTIIVVDGYDASQEQLYHQTCTEILSRGVNCLLLKGPGQPTVLKDQHLGFTPEWWTATSPAVDWLYERPDVDLKRIALLGFSYGATLAPIAAARDNRYSAVIALDGLINLRTAIEDQWPAELTALYNAGNATAFDAVVKSIQQNATNPSNLRWVIDESLYAFQTNSPYEWFTRMNNITMSPAVVRNLSMPVFVARGENDDLVGSQGLLAYDSLVENRANGQNLTIFHQFNTSLGAGEHCSIGADAELWSTLMQWLSGVWGGYIYAGC
ncbi:hypothetical protein LTR78_009471 [Recurvomyces mirabilis]|uniref:Uncharacterized protein n=1 Tax=Recurvomyces mirabilis TaxID=574656 RepID=A0AAE0TTI0_9PEZI|nr:hypothetical protein LTR78_009471 [Recurvomyces mirabilis]KAK5152376.1 hypothetical protein LTS14_008323 [Recurvomyces mirabilis]